MSFEKDLLQCEILTKFKPSLVCTVGSQDIIVADRNEIKFANINKSDDRDKRNIFIGANLYSPFQKMQLRADKDDRGDSEVSLLRDIDGMFPLITVSKSKYSETNSPYLTIRHPFIKHSISFESPGRFDMDEIDYTTKDFIKRLLDKEPEEKDTSYFHTGSELDWGHDYIDSRSVRKIELDYFKGYKKVDKEEEPQHNLLKINDNKKILLDGARMK